MPDLFDVLLGQRAHRELRPDPVPDEVIERVLDAAVHAPSAENLQPWAFVVVTEPDVRQAIADLTAGVWQRFGRPASQPKLSPRLFAEVDAWATGGLAAAPVHVVVCGDASVADAGLLPSSVYPAVQNLLLAALGLGLGSLLSTLPVVMADQFRAILGMPEHVVPLALVPLGYPARSLGPPRRVPAAAKTHRDRWGQPWSDSR